MEIASYWLSFCSHMYKIWEAKDVLCRNSSVPTAVGGSVSVCSSLIAILQNTGQGIWLPHQQLCFLPRLHCPPACPIRPCAFFWSLLELLFFGGRILFTSYYHAVNKIPGINTWKNIWQTSPQKFSPPDAVGHKHTRYKYAKTVLPSTSHNQSVFFWAEYEILIGKYTIPGDWSYETILGRCLIPFH